MELIYFVKMMVKVLSLNEINIYKIKDKYVQSTGALYKALHNIHTHTHTIVVSHETFCTDATIFDTFGISLWLISVARISVLVVCTKGLI